MTDMPEVAMDVKGLCERLEQAANWPEACPVSAGELREAATALSTLSRELAEARAERDEARRHGVGKDGVAKAYYDNWREAELRVKELKEKLAAKTEQHRQDECGWPFCSCAKTGVCARITGRPHQGAHMTAPDTDTLIALAREGRIAVVKPLEWAEDSHMERDYRSETARTTIGRYEAFSFTVANKAAAGWTSTLSTQEHRSPSLDAAKSAAQADYEQRILSALSLDVLALAEERDRLREALAEAIEFADQDAQALTAAGIALVGRWRRALTGDTP